MRKWRGVHQADARYSARRSMLKDGAPGRLGASREGAIEAQRRHRRLINHLVN
jgi:hypothetical protein